MTEAESREIVDSIKEIIEKEHTTVVVAASAAAAMFHHSQKFYHINYSDIP